MREAIIDIETTGLSPIGCIGDEKKEAIPESMIVCIGINIDGKKTIMFNRNDGLGMTEAFEDAIYFGNERLLLSAFWKFLNDEHIDVLVGFNLDFDWGFIKLRSLKHGIKMKNYAKYTERKDIREILNSQYKAPGKLGDYARFFGIAIDDDISGKEVPIMYQDKKKWHTIIKHLDSDIDLTYAIWKRLEECGLI